MKMSKIKGLGSKQDATTGAEVRGERPLGKDTTRRLGIALQSSDIGTLAGIADGIGQRPSLRAGSWNPSSNVALRELTT